MIFLKNYVKYRKEEDYLLLCDCSTVQNYELPLDTYVIFEKLRSGYDKTKSMGIKMEQDIITDLEELGLVDTKPNSNDGFHNNDWVNLSYSESEFF